MTVPAASGANGPMDTERLRIQDDLRGAIRGDVLCDPARIQLYASDASIYQIVPLAVVRPRNAQDVVATVQYAAEHGYPVHPRGGGTGVSGESLGPGLIIDGSAYMRQIRVLDRGQRVVVQTGTVLADLNRALRGHRRRESEDTSAKRTRTADESAPGRWYGPDPATRGVTTMGSVLAVNASGSHFLRSGSARDTVESVRVVTADGELVTFARHRGDLPRDGSFPTTADRLACGLAEIRRRFDRWLRDLPGGIAPRGGYRLDDVLDDSGGVDLAKFWAGSQGTLAIMVDATVRTEPIPRFRGIVVAFFDRLDAASRVALRALEHGVVACDLMDRRLLQIARETDPRFSGVLPRAAEAMLLVEIQGESSADLADRLSVLRRDLTRGQEGAFEAITTARQGERDQFWSLCRRVVPRQYRVRSRQKPLPFTEDACVPPDRLPSLIADIQDLLQRHHVTATLFAHAGHGELHVRPFLDLADGEDRGRLRALSEAVAEAAWRHGGQVGVEHPAGLSRSHLMPRQFGPLWQAMGQVKRLFDPENRLNPGKFFGNPLPQPDRHLRPANQTIEISFEQRVQTPADPTTIARAREAGQATPQLEVLQHWPGNAQIGHVARTCNGCGRCRADAEGERQCPVFRATRREEASPRAKANLLRGVLSGQLAVETLAEPAAKEIADLCFNCHQCRVDCPASVNIPKIVGELKAQYVATNGLPLSEFLMGRIDTVAAVGSRLPRVANLAIRNRFARWLCERLLGLSAARSLPPLARESFLRYAAKRRWTKASPHGGLKVAYFVDHYANYHDPDIGRALAEILQHNRIGIYVPGGQVSSGMPRISAGDLKGARKIARRNVRLLADVVRQGYTVIASEPSAALCLKYEYPNLLDDEDALLVAEHSHEACAYLWQLHQGGRLARDFRPIANEFAYHQPCHLRVLDDSRRAATQLMGLIPQLRVGSLEAGCTGMAGTWGLQKKNYRNSLRIGWPLISAMRSAGQATAVTECSACKLQIEHGSGRATIHPLKLFAHAYGRLPKVESELASGPAV